MLRGSLDVALAHPERADWPSVARTAVAGAERLERLTADLLLLHRVDGQAVTDRLTPLHDLITEQLAERALLGGRPATVLALDELLLPADELLLGRLLGNLLDNAERYAASRITLSLRVTDGTAELTVADDGPRDRRGRPGTGLRTLRQTGRVARPSARRLRARPGPGPRHRRGPGRDGLRRGPRHRPGRRAGGQPPRPGGCLLG
ncbi:hypothetical protein GCM10020229_08720 [Kitasatospora albolonga]